MRSVFIEEAQALGGAGNGGSRQHRLYHFALLIRHAKVAAQDRRVEVGDVMLRDRRTDDSTCAAWTSTTVLTTSRTGSLARKPASVTTRPSVSRSRKPLAPRTNQGRREPDDIVVRLVGESERTPTGTRSRRRAFRAAPPRAAYPVAAGPAIGGSRRLLLAGVDGLRWARPFSPPVKTRGGMGSGTGQGVRTGHRLRRWAQRLAPRVFTGG